MTDRAQHMLRLREYQDEAIRSTFKAWTEGTQRPAVVLPTGAGKTVIFSHLASQFRDWRTAANGDTLGPRRVVILVHRDELADQTIRKLAVIAPELNVGKVKAGDDEIGADVMVCSVQTLARQSRATRLLDAQAYAGDIGLVIVDECHHAVATSYRNIMAALGCYDSSTPVKAVGFTATLQRGDGRGLGGVWDEVVFTRSILWMISRGYLVDVRAQSVDVSTLNLKSVKRTAGDYTAKSLGDALMAADVPRIVTEVVRTRAADRRSVLVFTPTVEVAHAVQDGLVRAGLTAGLVHGGTPREERLLTYKRFAEGDMRVLVNCMVLTEGADFPFADCAVIARPTSNETLFIQMVGRVLRPSPATGKADALVLLLNGQGGSIRTLVDLEPDIETIADDESLAEAFEREQEAADTPVPAAAGLRFELKHKDLDLFKASPAYQWLRTRGGVQFIPLGGNGEILLWPSQEAGLWDVCHAPERGRWERLHTGLELGMALAWGESEADEHSAINTGKAASWRKKRASEAQLRYARGLGFQVEADMRAGEVGDMISVGVASRKIDRFARSA